MLMSSRRNYREARLPKPDHSEDRFWLWIGQVGISTSAVYLLLTSKLANDMKEEKIYKWDKDSSLSILAMYSVLPDKQPS
jgi:hypothetical protein